MSVIAVKKYEDKIVFGADSIEVRGTTQFKDKQAKMAEVNGIVILSTGYSRDHALFRLFCETRKPEAMTEMGLIRFFDEFIKWAKKNHSDYKLETRYIIGNNQKAFSFYNFHVSEVTDYEAAGAGMDYALAALYLGQSVRQAIEAACELSVYCEEPINIIEKPLKVVTN